MPARPRGLIPRLLVRPWAVATLAVGVYVACLVPFFAIDIGGADQSGYVAAARLFAAGHIKDKVRLIPDLESWKLDARAVAPLGMNAAPGRRVLVPQYPPGFPLHVAAARLFLTERAAVATTLAVLLGASLLLFAGVSRWIGISWLWTATGTSLLGIQPVFLFMSVQPMSDVAALAWAEASMLGAWMAHRHPRWAWLAGAGLGMAVAVRPSSIVLFAPVVVALPWTRAALARFVAGGLPCAVGLGWYNTSAHGVAWETGYPGHFALFSMDWVAPALVHYATWLPRFFSWPVVALAVAMPWVCRRRASVASALVVWVLAYLGFYAAYRFTHESWGYLRFVLPAFPAIILAALLTAQDLASRLAPGRQVLPFVVAGLVLVSAATSVARRPEIREYRFVAASEGRYRTAAEWMDGKLPRNAVLSGMQMTGAVYLYTARPFLRWEYVFDEDWPLVERFVTARRREFYAILFPFEEEEVFQRSWRPLPGRWTEFDRLGDVRLWRYEGPLTPAQ